MPASSPVTERTAASLSALSTMLLVLSVGLVVGGFAMPGAAGRPAYRSMAAAAPVRLVVPSLRIDAPVVPVSLSSGAVLDPPRDPEQVGWWDDSAEPGDDQGQTVITGHTVHTGGGAMDHIGEVRRGAVVDVVTRHGTMRYRVDRVKVIGKDRLARTAPKLFGQGHGGGRLVLVTCAGWNGSYYPSNVVVLGHPLGVPTHSRRHRHPQQRVEAAAAHRQR